MRNISIKWRMTLWFSLLMIAITALMLVFVMLMNRNTVTRPPEAELLYMVDRNADDVEFDHGGWDFSDVEQYAHGVYTEIFDEDGQRLFGTAPAEVSDARRRRKTRCTPSSAAAAGRIWCTTAGWRSAAAACGYGAPSTARPGAA